MRSLLSTQDAEEVLLEEEFALISEVEITDSEEALEHPFGQGYSRSIVLEGLVIVQAMHMVERDIALKSEQAPASLEIHFSLQGGVVAQVQGLQETLHFRPGTHILHYVPASRLRFALAPDRRYERFEMNLTTDYLASLAERYPQLLGEVFSHVERQQPFCPDAAGRVTTPRMQSVIRQILESQEQGPVRRMFVEAKVTELLALMLQQHEAYAMRPAEAQHLSMSEVDRMHEARHLVLTRMDDPPTLPELARAVGTNEFTLKRQFKKVFGKTVYGLLLDYKMEHARTLILDTDRPLGAIARDVGYSHPTHFSTAFKKKFGIPPSALRRW